jgi:Flp pilus assembly protein TadD
MISATSCQDATWKFANNQAICRYLNGKGNDAKSVLEQAVRDSNGSNESVVLNLARVVEDVGG